MDERKIPQMVSVKKAAQMSGLPEHLVRFKLIPEGKIKYILAGRKILVNFDSLVEYLQVGDGSD